MIFSKCFWSPSPPQKKKKIREQKFENILFSLGDEMYGDLTIREGVLCTPQLFKRWNIGCTLRGRIAQRRNVWGRNVRGRIRLVSFQLTDHLYNNVRCQMSVYPLPSFPTILASTHSRFGPTRGSRSPLVHLPCVNVSTMQTSNIKIQFIVCVSGRYSPGQCTYNSCW